MKRQSGSAPRDSEDSSSASSLPKRSRRHEVVDHQGQQQQQQQLQSQSEITGQQEEQQQHEQDETERRREGDERSCGDDRQRQSKKCFGKRHRKRCVCLPNNYTPVQFPAVWSELRTSKKLCDGLIRCSVDERRTFHVHRAILSAISPYFKALFTNSLRSIGSEDDDAATTTTTNLCEIAVPDASPDVLSLILDYAYTGECRVDVGNVEQLLPLADRLECLGVVQICCRFLLDELRPDNCLGIFKFARHYFCQDLEERGRKYIHQNFERILAESAEFKELTFDELEPILRDDELNARSERHVFEAIRTWCEHRAAERTRHLPRLLDCVRYGLMDGQYFRERVLDWGRGQDDECQEMMRSIAEYVKEREAKRYLAHGWILDNKYARPRVPYEILFAVGGWSFGSPTNFVETYDTRADRWFLSPYTDSTPRAYHGVCTLNNLIYLVGGYDGRKYYKLDNYLNTMSCFDPTTKEWREKACMYQARCFVSVCTHDGKIYALGGNNGLMRMSSCERYDPATNQWELIESMNWPRSDASCCVAGDRIYIAGGWDGQFVLNSAEVYDVASNQWSYVALMGVQRTGLSLVAFRDAVYAIAGFDGYDRLSSVEKYNPSQDAWQEVSEMDYPRSNFATAIIDDMIFVIGGYDGYLPISFVECYDADLDEWYDAAPMNLCRSGLKVCVLSGLTNARDYSYHRQNLAPWPKQRKKSKRGGERAVASSASLVIVG